MTIQHNEFIKFIEGNGFERIISKFKIGKHWWQSGYNPGEYLCDNTEIRHYKNGKLHVYLDWNNCYITSGKKFHYNCLMYQINDPFNYSDITYFPIPPKVLNFIQHKDPFYIAPRTVSYSTDRDKRYISKMLRLELLIEFKMKCAQCGSGNELQIDHIYPWSKGGKTVKENLQVLCKPCNYKKSNKIIQQN